MPRGRPRKVIDVTEVEIDGVQSETEAAEPVASTLPKKIKFTRPYGYDDAGGHMHYWMTGQVEEDATSIATVIARGCTDWV